MMLVPFWPTLSVALPHRQLERHFKERLLEHPRTTSRLKPPACCHCRRPRAACRWFHGGILWHARLVFPSRKKQPGHSWRKSDKEGSRYVTVAGSLGSQVPRRLSRIIRRSILPIAYSGISPGLLRNSYHPEWYHRDSTVHSARAGNQLGQSVF